MSEVRDLLDYYNKLIDYALEPIKHMYEIEDINNLPESSFKNALESFEIAKRAYFVNAAMKTFQIVNVHELNLQPLITDLKTSIKVIATTENKLEKNVEKEEDVLVVLKERPDIKAPSDRLLTAITTKQQSPYRPFMKKKR